MRTVGVVKEQAIGETRVAIVPEIALSLVKDKSCEIWVEQGAGLCAGFADEDYEKVGAKIAPRKEVIARSEILFAINGEEFFLEHELANKLLVGLFDPFFKAKELKQLKDQGASVLALELVPRISRAQSMDVLSSQANIAGYASVVLAASKLSKVIPLMMTAAGTVKPAKILIVGAGVAGLQAIATAKRLGAVVHAYDVRSVVKEQVESLGGKFVTISVDESAEGSGGYAKALSEATQAELREKLTHFAKDMDIVITTAQIPGKRAPLLLNESIFNSAKSGAIIIDMAASTGGNVSGSVVGEWQRKGKVLLYGAHNLACMMPADASFTFSKNNLAMLELLLTSNLNTEDEILKDALVCHQGNWINQTIMQFTQAN